MQAADDTLRTVRYRRAQQLRTLRSVDDLVAGTFALLDRLDENRDTIAFFVSDNGYLWWEHRLQGKRQPYHQSTRIPFLVRYPGSSTLAPGTVDPRLVANIDIAPTVLDAAGVDPPDGPPMDGRSLLSEEARTELLLEHWNQMNIEVPDWAGIVAPGRFSFTEYFPTDGVTEAGFVEYYDLSADPWELDNLLADGPTDNDPNLVELRAKLIAYSQCSGATCP